MTDAQPPSRRIVSLRRAEDSLIRFPGDGDGLTTTWAADDRQLVALEDGIGWGSDWQRFAPPEGGWNSRLFAMTGGPGHATFEDIPGYPRLTPLSHDEPHYYGFGTLALDGAIYQFLSAQSRPYDPRGWRWTGAKLIFSLDEGGTWHNVDGSTPVTWEEWEDQSRATMTFWDEPQEAFSLLSFLQMGRGYELNRDGHVYVYGPNGNTDETMSELVMFRVPRQRIADRSAYEYFAGIASDGSGTWTPHIEDRAPTHVFPRGWVNDPTPTIFNIESWVPCVVYYPPLDLYLMTSFGASPGGRAFSAPSYLGFWTAPTPWGPWTQVHEETAWTPAGDGRARAFNAQIPPRWIAEDGTSFWLAWADFQGPEFRGIEGDPEPSGEEGEELGRPYYTFNTQRVDVVIG